MDVLLLLLITNSLSYLVVEIFGNHLHVGTLLQLLRVLHPEADLGQGTDPIRLPELFFHHD